MTAVACAHTVDTVDTVDMGAKNRANAKTKLPGYIERYVITYRGIERFSRTPSTLSTVSTLVCRREADAGKDRLIRSQQSRDAVVA
jgi:hypothetical protein